MKKKRLLIAAIMVMMLSVTACGSKNKDADTSDTIGDSATLPAGETTDNTDITTEVAANTAAGTLTGTVDKNKGIMITIISDSDQEPYVFSLTDTQSTQYQNIKDGDKVSVTYTNGLPSPDNFDTVVTEIKKL